MTSGKERKDAPNALPLWGRVISVSVFLLVPALYVFGRSYWDAWLDQHGLSQATFPLSVDEAIFKSYEGVLWLGISTLPLIARVSLLLIGLLLFWGVVALFLKLWSKTKPRLKGHLIGPVNWIERFIARHREKLVAAAKSYQIAATPFLVLGIAFFTFLLLLLPLLLGYYLGKWQGERNYADLRARIAAGKVNDGEQILITDSRDELRLIACGELGCGGASVKGTEFLRWDRIERIVQSTSQSKRSANSRLEDNRE